MQRSEICPLCKHEDSKQEPRQHRDAIHYSCPRCGEYHIGRHVLTQESYGFEENSFELACVAREWHLTHPDKPFVLVEEDGYRQDAQAVYPHYRVFSLKEMREQFPKPSKCLDRALLNCSRLVERDPFKTLELVEDDAPYILFSEKAPQFILAELDACGLIYRSPSAYVFYCQITTVGWQRIEELTMTDVDSSQCFIAMWFDESMGPVQDALREGIALAGYNPLVVSDVEHNGKVCDEIIAQIRQSRFIVADFTAGHCPPCEDCSQEKDKGETIVPRGGVYFEAGFAMGLGIPVIWTVREDQMKQVHFDTNHYSHIIYTDSDDLKVQLKNRIEATIGKGPL